MRSPSLLRALLSVSLCMAPITACADALSDLLEKLETKAPVTLGEGENAVAPDSPPPGSDTDPGAKPGDEVTRQRNFPLRGNLAGGALVVMDRQPPGGPPTRESVLANAALISEILVFPPALVISVEDPNDPTRTVLDFQRASFLNMFSDSLPNMFLIHDPRSATTGYPDFTTTLGDLLDNTKTIADIYGNPDLLDLPGGNVPRQVGYMLEGTLVDTSPNPVMGKGPFDLTAMGIFNTTIFIQPFRGDRQPYVILSDNPVPEPSTLVLLVVAMLGLVARQTARHAGGHDARPEARRSRLLAQLRLIAKHA